MQILIRLIKVFVFTIIIFLILLFAATFYFNKKAAEFATNAINTNLSTKSKIGSLRLSLLRRFPNASFEIKNLVIYSSSGYNRKEFEHPGSDTLLSSEKVSVEFNLKDILKGNYKINRISLKNGFANLLTDKNGQVNYNVFPSESKSNQENLTIDLENIILSHIKVTYINNATQVNTSGIIDDSRLKSRISGENVNVSASGTFMLNYLGINNSLFKKNLPANYSIKIEKNNLGVTIEKGSLSLDNLKFRISGNISKNNSLNLKIEGEDVDISKLVDFLPESISEKVKGYKPSGILTINGSITGLLSDTNNPHIELFFNIKNGTASYKGSDLKLKNFGFEGSYTNGPANNARTTILSIKNIKADIGSAQYSGDMTLTDFHKKFITSINLSGRFFPEEIRKFFKIESILSASGSADFKLKATTDLFSQDSIVAKDILDLYPSGEITFNNLSFAIKHNNLSISNINGFISINNRIKLEDLHAEYKNHHLSITGEVENLQKWISGESYNLIVKAEVASDNMNFDSFFSENNSSPVPGEVGNAIHFPEYLDLDIKFNTGSFSYRKYRFSPFIGRITYKTGLLTFNSLNLGVSGGTIFGNGFFGQNKDRTIILKGIFDLKNLDIKETFKTFNNFGQTFIVAENLEGKLTGNVSVLIPYDSTLKPHIKSLTAEGKYILTNGTLVNFDPVKQLSSFIELSELETIRFEKIENDFFIKNNYLYVPQMDIRSSAADFSLNGKHSFDNDYEYHIKIHLSEILSKKRKKKPENMNEFGAVQDDGLGRTSILLKVENTAGKFKVGYDVKAAGTQIKTSINSERKTLKTILNEEYGWYKTDTTIKSKPEEKKQRFRISWEGNDTLNKVDTDNNLKKDTTVKRLFRKR